MDGLDFHNAMQWAAVIAVLGGLWWRFKQWSTERDSMTKWRVDKDHADANTQERMERMEAKQEGLERDWRNLYERQVHLEAQMKARG